MTLIGKTIALLISPKGTEQVEFTKPLEALNEAGATVHRDIALLYASGD